jgi:REP element-mobilizing transposase RayT
MGSRYIHKQHNVSVLMYHLVCAAKYRRVVMDKHVDEILREGCLEIEKRWEIVFLEIGLDRNRAHFLIQSVRTYSVAKIATTVKSLIER